MRYRTLAHSSLEVSAIGLGLMSMSGIYGKANDDECISTIHHAIDKGINLLDSSDMYGWGHNEGLLGRAIKDRRDRAVIIPDKPTSRLQRYRTTSEGWRALEEQRP